MVVKTLELLLLQQGAPERIKLVEINLENPADPVCCYNHEALREEYWVGISKGYDLGMLATNYIEGISRFQQVVAEIVNGTANQDQASMENCIAHPFVYASPAAYQVIKPKFEKEKEHDHEPDSIAHISWEEGDAYGIFVSLIDNCNNDNLISSNIHEHGHYIHLNLDQEHYRACDTTMKEVMAIFMEMKCGLSINYVYSEPGKESPHHRAQKLLFNLEKAEFYTGMNTQTQWKFLTCFHAHQNLQELTEAVLSRKVAPPLEEIIIDVE